MQHSSSQANSPAVQMPVRTNGQYLTAYMQVRLVMSIISHEFRPRLILAPDPYPRRHTSTILHLTPLLDPPEAYGGC